MLNTILELRERDHDKINNSIDAMKYLMQEYLARATLNSRKIRLLAERLDVTGHSALMYLERYDAYQLMESSIIN